MFIYIYVYIYTNLPVNAIVRQSDYPVLGAEEARPRKRF